MDFRFLGVRVAGTRHLRCRRDRQGQIGGRAVVTLDEIKQIGQRLSPWAHLATVGADGAPDVVPVHPCWEGDVLWVMVGSESTKVRNLAVNPEVALHWQVTEVGDGLEVWGTATVHEDVETKRRLWSGVFDYDLNLFAPGGPDASPGTAFVAVRPNRAVYLAAYGMRGVERWSRSGSRRGSTLEPSLLSGKNDGVLPGVGTARREGHHGETHGTITVDHWQGGHRHGCGIGYGARYGAPLRR